MQPGRPLPFRLSSYRSDEALGAKAKRAVVEREGKKRDDAVQCDVGHHRAGPVHSSRLISILQSNETCLATQRREPQSDSESLPSSTVKMPLSPPLSPPLGPIAPLPQITQLKRRSQSMREWRRGLLDVPDETFSKSTLVGTAGLNPKSRPYSPG